MKTKRYFFIRVYDPILEKRGNACAIVTLPKGKVELMTPEKAKEILPPDVTWEKTTLEDFQSFIAKYRKTKFKFKRR